MGSIYSPLLAAFSKFNAHEGHTKAARLIDSRFSTTNAGALASAGPAGVAGGVFKMQGLAIGLTPKDSGNAFFWLNGGMQNTAANALCNIGIRYGTGTAPVNGAAVTGTTIGIDGIFNGHATAAGVFPVSVYHIVTGLTLGTTYWFDVAICGTAVPTTCTLFRIMYGAIEVP
jgi:hypothetical protein